MQRMSDATNRRWQRVLVPAALVVIALAPRLYRLDWSLPHMYEEAKPFHVAWDMWGWTKGGDVDLNPHFFNYPSLTFYVQFIAQGLLYLAMKLAGHVETIFDWFVIYYAAPTPLFLTARMVNALFGAATALVAFGSAARVGGQFAAWLAFLLIALNPYHITRSQMIEVDIPLTFFAALALYGSIGVVTHGRRRDSVLAGVAAGLAASCKYTGAILLVAVAVAHFARRNATHKARVGGAALAVALAAVAFVATSPYVVFDALEASKDFASERRHMAEGHFGIAGGPSWWYYAKSLFGTVVGIPVVIAALGGIALGVRNRVRAIIVVASFVIAYLAVISSWAMKVERYLLPLIPPFAILAGFATEAAFRGLQARPLRIPTRALAVGLCALVVIPGFVHYVGTVRSLHRESRTDAHAWFDAHVAGGSFVVSEYYGPDFMGPDALMTMNPALRKRVIERVGAQHIFAMHRLPMFQTAPERSAPFYSLDLYPNADYFIVSSAVASRYRREPERYAPQLAFYRALEESLVVAGDFPPAREGDIRITVYRRRVPKVPFGVRESVEPPPVIVADSRVTGDAVATFYYEMGASYEFFRRPAEALVSYQRGLAAGMNEIDLFHNSVLGETRSLLALGRSEEALNFLRNLSAKVEHEGERASLRRMADDLAKAMQKEGK